MCIWIGKKGVNNVLFGTAVTDRLIGQLAGRISRPLRYRGSFSPDHTIPLSELLPEKRAFVVRQHDGARVLNTMAWGFLHKVLGKRIGKATGKPVLLDKRVTNVRKYI